MIIAVGNGSGFFAEKTIAFYNEFILQWENNCWK
jgi:hypothetical protein